MLETIPPVILCIVNRYELGNLNSQNDADSPAASMGLPPDACSRYRLDEAELCALLPSSVLRDTLENAVRDCFGYNWPSNCTLESRILLLVLIFMRESFHVPVEQL